MQVLHKQWLQISRLLRGEYVVNAVRCTSVIVAPVIVFANIGLIITGIYMGLGTLLVSLTDLPGPRVNRLRFLILGSLTLGLVAFITAVAQPSPWLIALLMISFCFGFSMLAAYGGNLNAIGSLALIMMVFAIGLRPVDPFSFALPVISGGIWYTACTGIDTYFFPHRSINNALSECMIAMSHFLRKKAEFYNGDIPLADAYKDIIPGHLSVCEKQESLRTILLSKTTVFNKDYRSGKLIRLTAEVIDLYEQILAIHYDYEFVRKTLQELDILEQIKRMIEDVADQLYLTGISLHVAGKKRYQIPIASNNAVLTQLKQVAQMGDANTADLINAICKNIEQICNKLTLINTLAVAESGSSEEIDSTDAIRFSSIPRIDFSILKQHLSYHSPIFRFALRLTVLCMVAYILMLFVLPGKYSYWLLLTIVIIARPGFSVTKRRNVQRIAGSLAGIFIAYGLLNLRLPIHAQFLLIAAFLAGYIGFLYVNYLVSVIFITIVAIIGLHLLGGNNHSLLIQRSYTVLLGGGMALVAAFLFPSWETNRIRNLIKNALASNINLLEDLVSLTKLQSVNLIEYKLKRKQVFVDTANLYKSFEHLRNEPPSTGFDLDLLYRFQVFNHELYASTSSLFHSQLNEDQFQNNPDIIKSLEFSLSYLKKGLSVISGTAEVSAISDKEPHMDSYCFDDHFDVPKQLEVITIRAPQVYDQTKMMNAFWMRGISK
ncbi:FUSC family protein [Mucilaginibacter kameinonensis]|uniref:FUSC family protein n=1 Tax=Mucilaginibacter kameinonensis TaxID=452286 RepID=UPI000EF7A735|nr:FUSC family membrane protein [Mucilaginibacter kameinonensis]